MNDNSLVPCPRANSSLDLDNMLGSYPMNIEHNKRAIAETIHDVQNRLQWRIGSKCLVYSRSAATWTDGQILNITVDEESNEEWMTVQYSQHKKKRIQRCSTFIQTQKSRNRLPIQFGII